jgi:23S rRNA (cytosine1962-C5)-methyltransferase
MLREIHINPGEERRIRRGHLWVYSNEIADNLKDYNPGEPVTVLDSKNRPLGSGIVNPNNLIAVRIHSRNGKQDLDKDYLKKRIDTAWRLRQNMGYGNVCRVVHGEADGLPGLIVDRYEDVISIQHNSVGMDARRGIILEVLDELFSPTCVIAADDSNSRELEGLPLERGIAGDSPGDIFWYELDGIKLPMDMTEGQKTGSYLDQVTSRRIVAKLCRDKKVFDGFSYTGAFGLYASKHGAKEVILADRSERALEVAKEAFKVNGFTIPETLKVDLLHGKVGTKDISGPFDITILDPPPLVKKKSKQAEGLKRYETLFSDGLGWTKHEGFASFYSCSYNVRLPDLLEIIKRSERRSLRRLKRLDILGAGSDHPISISHPETEYLHGVLLAVG